MSDWREHAPLSGPPFCLIQPGKEKSLKLARAIVKGHVGGQIHIGELPTVDMPDHVTPVFVGLHNSTCDTLWATYRARRPFVTVDNGYFKPYKRGGYFRATTNAMQWVAASPEIPRGRKQIPPIGLSRFLNLGIDLPRAFDPSRPGYILLVLQSNGWMDMMGLHPVEWTETVIRTLEQYTDRPVVVRRKPRASQHVVPIEEQLREASAVVGFSSNVLVEAAMRGIPVFPLGYCAASAVGTPDLSLIEQPPQPERVNETMFALAANQWTIEEIESGRMWRDLQDRYDPEFLSLA